MVDWALHLLTSLNAFLRLFTSTTYYYQSNIDSEVTIRFIDFNLNLLTESIYEIFFNLIPIQNYEFLNFINIKLKKLKLILISFLCLILIYSLILI